MAKAVVIPLVTKEQALRESRCVCGGCKACRAGNGTACGVNLAFYGETMCSWCRRFQNAETRTS